MALPKTTELILDLQSSVLTVWLNRPESKNALSDEMSDELSQVFDAVYDDREIRAIILRGMGGVFCAGGNIKGFKAIFQGDMSRKDIANSNRVFGNLLTKINEQPQLVIMLVEGAAIGGGLGLACVGDVTIVTSDARFRLSETSLGIPPAQIAPFVTERVGITHARRLMLTGAAFNGEEAVGYGIAHIVAQDTEDLDVQCAQVLKQLNYCAPSANAVTKSLIFNSSRNERSEALDAAAELFAECMLSDEGREGVAAFVEKRKARWVK
jgi:isohexenylglutaconyl-CoA hydratase